MVFSMSSSMDWSTGEQTKILCLESQECDKKNTIYCLRFKTKSKQHLHEKSEYKLQFL